MVSHKELVEITALKVQTLFNCGLVLKEPKSIRLKFSPDIFAVKKGGVTLQFEIKVSRSDFLKEYSKPHRKEEMDVGAYRYFVVPWGLVDPNDFLFSRGDFSKWGLIWVSLGKSKRFKIMRGVTPKNNLKLMGENNVTPESDVEIFRCKSNTNAEMEFVYSAYRSLVLGSSGEPIRLNSVVERIYTSPSDLKAICCRIA